MNVFLLLMQMLFANIRIRDIFVVLLLLYMICGNHKDSNNKSKQSTENNYNSTRTQEHSTKDKYIKPNITIDDYKKISDKVKVDFIGQDRQIEYLTKIIVAHYLSCIQGANSTPLVILVVGPSGCGKTSIITKIAEQLNITKYVCSATSLTVAPFIGLKVEDICDRIIDEAGAAGKDPAYSLLLVDELDKICVERLINSDKEMQAQESFLTLLNGSIDYRTSNGRQYDTSKMVVIFTGAFTNKIRDRINEDNYQEELSTYHISNQLLNRVNYICKLEDVKSMDDNTLECGIKNAIDNIVCSLVNDGYNITNTISDKDYKEIINIIRGKKDNSPAFRKYISLINNIKKDILFCDKNDALVLKFCDNKLKIHNMVLGH